MTLFLLICSGLIAFIWHSGEVAIGEVHGMTEGSAESGPRNIFASMRLVFSSSYLSAIAAVICISSLVTTLTGWQFLALMQQFLVKKDADSCFLRRLQLLRRHTFAIVPVALHQQISAQVWYWYSAVHAPRYRVVGVGRAAGFRHTRRGCCTKRLRPGTTLFPGQVHDRVLYLPLPTRIKLQIKWFIDTVIWRLGDGLSGLVVLIFATTLHWPARQISWIALLLVSGWLVAVAVARRQYVVTLNDSIAQHRVDVEQASTSVLDRSTSDLMAAKLSTSDPQEILYALSLFEVERERAVHPVVRGLLSHSSPEVRQKAIRTLSKTGDKTVRPEIEHLLRDSDLSVRTEALLYLT